MPSSMSANDPEDPPLSNQEIETLYDIVRHAQTISAPPLRALFDAYDHVRAERRDIADGSRYIRFLLGMHEERERDNESESLVERFRRRLDRMGIQVEIDPDGEGIEATGDLDNALGNGQGTTQNSLGRTSRRGSFDSFFDGAADKVAGTDFGNERTRRSRRASGAASDQGEHWERRRSRSDTQAHSQQLKALPIRARVNGHATQRSISEGFAGQPRRRGSVSSRGSLRIQRDGDTATRPFDDYEGDDSEQTDSFDRSHIQIPGVNAPLPGADDDHQFDPAAYRPSDTQIARDAETLDYRRICNVARRCMRRWRDEAVDRNERRAAMEAAADAKYSSVILRASMDYWRTALQNRRLAVETEHFFERLESRAEKARNLFLLTKAFTHWAKSAEDEVQRTSTARRHILRTRYFNAWRDITAVNELKIQHFVLRKFLGKWRTRTAAVVEQNDMAVGLYQDNIVYRLYWQWFWKFADRRAPILYENRLKRETFRKWAEIVGLLKEREAWASDQRDRTLVRRAFEAMRRKLAATQSLDSQADEFRRSAQLSSGFYVLRKQSQLAPRYADFTARIDMRLVSTAFRTWRHDAQLSRQAREVNRMRVLRNAFTAWNDRLRVKAVEDRINDRVQVECLYKWALASRVSLFHRVHNHHLKQTVFRTWIAKTQDRETRLQIAEQRFAEFKRRQTLRFCLRKLENKTIERRDLEHLALSVSAPKLKHRMLEMWREKHEHLQQLDNWAQRAEYYVTAKHALKRWQNATEHARRNRRRESYAQMRRTVKMNLVRRIFSTWRDKAAMLEVQQRQADEVVENRVLRKSTGFLAQWQTRNAAVHDLRTQAIQLHNTKLLSHHLSLWLQKFHYLQSLEAKAVALRQETTDLAAASRLKKWGWKLWTIQRQEETTLALHQRNFEKHCRAMIRFWWEQTQERLAQRDASPTPSSRHRGGPGRDDDGDEEQEGDEEGDADLGDGQEGGANVFEESGDETRRLEAWTAFDASALGLKDSNLDLSFSISPQPPPQSQPRSQSRFRNPRQNPTPGHPPPALRQSQRLGATPARPTPRPATHPPTALSSLRRPPPAPIQEEMTDLEDEDDPEFWASTPFHPHPSSIAKPVPVPMAGYLKTPSKRSVARAKRPELPPSPEKRVVGLVRERERGVAASAPPATMGFVDRGNGGVTSFERRLREGGFGGGILNVGGGGGAVGERGRGRGRGRRVGFGDLDGG